VKAGSTHDCRIVSGSQGEVYKQVHGCFDRDGENKLLQHTLRSTYVITYSTSFENSYASYVVRCQACGQLHMFVKPVEHMIGSECEFWNKGRFSTNVVLTPDELACGVFLLKSQLPPLATVASGCLAD
jgi:hypothetical protein